MAVLNSTEILLSFLLLSMEKKLNIRKIIFISLPSSLLHFESLENEIEHNLDCVQPCPSLRAYFFYPLIMFLRNI